MTHSLDKIGCEVNPIDQLLPVRMRSTCRCSCDGMSGCMSDSDMRHTCAPFDHIQQKSVEGNRAWNSVSALNYQYRIR